MPSYERWTARRLLPHAWVWCAVLAPFVCLALIMLSGISAVEKGDGGRVIRQGHESRVMAFLGDDARAFADTPIGNVIVDHDVIILQMVGSTLEPCDATRGVEPPGRVFIGPKGSAMTGAPSAPSGDLTVWWRTCGVPENAAKTAGDRLAQALSNRPSEGVWSFIEEHAASGVGGLLTPFIQSVGARFGPPARLLGSLFALATILSFFAARMAPRNVDSSWSGSPSTFRPFALPTLVFVALFVIGAALRLRAAAYLPIDGDEPWAFPSPHSIVTNDHDAWVHPPMHRALQQAWVEAIGWHQGQSLWSLRLLSVATSLAALSLLFGGLYLGIRQLGSRVFALSAVALLAAAVAPAIVTSSVLARPYALAALAVVIVLVSLLPRAGADPAQWCWFLALLCLALAAWTDLIAGLAAGVVIALATARSLIRFRRRALPSAVLALIATLVFCAPLLQGATADLRDQVHPATTGVAAPDLRPATGAGHGEFSGLLLSIAQFDAIGLDTDFDPGVLGLIVMVTAFAGVSMSAKRARDLASGVVPWALFFLCVVVGRRVGLRARNILFLPLVSALLVARALADETERRRVKSDVDRVPSRKDSR